MAPFETLVDLIPNTEDLEEEVDEGFEAEVDLGGDLPDAERDGQEGAGSGGGDAGGLAEFGAIFSELAGTSALVAGLLGTAVGLLASLEPIQAILDLLFTSLQIFLFPIAQLLFTLLRPVLTGLLDLIPIWLDFFQGDPGESTFTDVAEEAGLEGQRARIAGSAFSDIFAGTLPFLNPAGIGLSQGLGFNPIDSFQSGFSQLSDLFSSETQPQPQQNQTTVNVNGLDPDAQVEKIENARDNATRRTFGR